MKALFFLTVVFLPAFGLFAQNEPTWNLYQAVNGIEVYTQEVDCYAENIPSQKAILIKIVNTNSIDFIVDWDLKVWYGGELQTDNVKDGENHHSTVIKANSEVAGTCDVPHGALYIYKDFILYTAPTKLTQFELDNINAIKK